MKKNRHTSKSLLADPARLGPEITAKAIRTMPPNVRVRTVKPSSAGNQADVSPTGSFIRDR